MSIDKDSSHHFHFTLGPVQSFISQARRTRDFWAGSFILSWLSAVAMQAVLEQHDENKIEFPEPDSDYLKWLKGKKTGNYGPQQGGVPNRFKAKVQDSFQPEIVVAAVNAAWQALADKIYAGDLAKAGGKTQEIWDRQVQVFWEINWVITDDATDSSALDVRKNWRSYLPPEERGVKCMMMDGWQELSGADRPNADALQTFWQDLRQYGKKGIKSDLRKNEHLCAIAFIKRRFVRYFDDELLSNLPEGTVLKGWKLTVGRPSVAYMAAVHWLKNVLIQAQSHPDVADQLWRFHDTAIELTDGTHNEWDNQIACIKHCDTAHKWKALDGNVFFESALENANIFDDQNQAKQVIKELKELQRLLKLSAPEFQPATPFYAVLMMDGDSLGKQMSDPDKQTPITQGLKEFTDEVSTLVTKNNGFLIYAGGDDVLAVLPLEDALGCALAIRQHYESVFAGPKQIELQENRVQTSISAAVVFAPIKMPLMKVLKEAHDLLDNVAKEEYGRDALAVSVWKPGGCVLQWARPWIKALTQDETQLEIERLADTFSGDDKDGQFSNKFLYKIRERFDLLNPREAKPGSKSPQAVLSPEQALDLMAAEYFSSGLCESKYPPANQLAHAKAVVAPLLEQCCPVYRDELQPDPWLWPKADKVLPDAALLVRFLAQKGVNL